MAVHEFMNYKNWLVCGRVDDESKYAYKILKTLRENGYHAEGFHPDPKVGPGVYHDFSSLPFQPDVLDLVIRTDLGLEIVKEAYAAGIRRILAQPGARSEEIAAFCREHEMEYAEECALVEMGKMKGR